MLIIITAKHKFKASLYLLLFEFLIFKHLIAKKELTILKIINNKGIMDQLYISKNKINIVTKNDIIGNIIILFFIVNLLFMYDVEINYALIIYGFLLIFN